VNPKVKFVDFWPNFNVEKSYLWKLMARNFGAVMSEDPDYLVYSIYEPSEHVFNARYDKCVKILWTGENVAPDFRASDYALSFEYMDDVRNLRWPLYAEQLAILDRIDNLDDHESGRCLVRPGNLDVRGLLASKTKFCNFVYSDGSARERVEFLKLLSRYKKVDSGGGVENNLGYRVADKFKFMSDYKFTIAFENSSRAGYVTEKIVDPLTVYSVPIYWGSPCITDDFSPGCFVNCHDYASLGEVVDRIVELDRCDDLYSRYLGASCFEDNKPNSYCQPDYLSSFLAKIFSDRVPRSAKERCRRTVRDNIDNWTAYV
jgi:hypothetical protein